MRVFPWLGCCNRVVDYCELEEGTDELRRQSYELLVATRLVPRLSDGRSCRTSVCPIATMRSIGIHVRVMKTTIVARGTRRGAILSPAKAGSHR
jgi:hypothetical protein